MIRNLSQRFLLLLFVLVSSFCYSVASAQDLVVAKDGTGNYTTVQAAIDAAPTGRTTPFRIFIKNGKYKEKINIPNTKPFIQLIGESVANVILTHDDYSGKPMPGGGTYGTSTSASVTVRAADFTAINITFENTTGESPQALALYVDGQRAAFKNCRFLGGQDTLYAGGNGAVQYYYNCYIDGTVDFIFGDARAVFDSCVIYPKTRSASGASYITAANTKSTEPYGYVFRDCIIPGNRGVTSYWLGRPWQNDANTAAGAKSHNKTVFLNTTMSGVIRPEGWSTWDAGTDVSLITYGEYRSRKFDSSLVDVSQRVAWSKQFTAAEAAVYYNNSNLFGSWDPCTVTADFCTWAPSPIAVSNFKGVKGSSTSTFTWNISWPIAGVKYELFRSADNINFTEVNEQTSVTDTAVNFMYSEAIPPPGATYYYFVQASKAGYASHITDTISISSTPTIKVTGSMGSFIQGVGTPSTSQSYIVSATSLTNNLVVTAPASYEVSLNGTSWNNSTSPILLVPDANGNISNTTVFVRLNATTAGSYAGDIIHASNGADTVRLAVSGTVQSAPLSASEILQWWPMTVNNADSAAVRSAGVTPSTPTFNKLYLSNGTTVASVPAYSPNHGQAFGANPNGDGNWSTGAGGPGGNLNRTYYEQFTVTAQPTHSLRIDSLVLNTVIQNSANGRFALVYSRSGFASDSIDHPNASFATHVALTNQTSGNDVTLRFAFDGVTGINLASGETLTFRLYYAVGSTSAGRYAKLKNVMVKGLANANPVVGDYRTRQSGDWTDLSIWERWDGATWVTPAPAYPVYNNSTSTTILNGHTVTLSATLANGSGYIARTKINQGGQVIVNNGASLRIANDGAPSTATTDLQVDGTLTVFGAINTNGNVSIKINGSFVNSSTGSTNMGNTGDTVEVGTAGIYHHNINSNSTPANMIWQQGSTFLVTGIVTNQTDIFKKNIKYSNIIWNNQQQQNYYAFRTTLDSSNVKGSFTVQSTGTSFVSFSNTSTRVAFGGGYYQTGGTVNYRENGTVTDTLDVNGDFVVTGGTFNSNMNTGSSLLIRLTGTNKVLNYSQATAVNTNWEVNGSYTLASILQIPSNGFAVTVKGTLLTAPDKYVVTGGTARLVKNNLGAINNLFAVGPNTTSYNPVIINNAGTADNFSVNVKTTFDQPVPDANKVVNRQWTINEEVAGGSDVTLSLSWTTADQAAGFDPAASASIIRFDGTSWVSYPATITGAGTVADPYVATASGITAFSPFTVINDAALPVQLLSFNAGYLDGKVNTWWSSANEVNLQVYDVERSKDGRSFDRIGSVEARNLVASTAYAFTDSRPLDGVGYYRLKMLDKDGKFSYSRIATVNSKLVVKLSVYPNPAANWLTVTHAAAGKQSLLEVIAQNGAKVLTQTLQQSATQTALDVSALPAGVYTLLLNDGDKTSVRFIKQ